MAPARRVGTLSGMAEPGGTGGIDDVVLDEDFVRGASISELDAAKRAKAKAKEKAKADKRERRLYRRHVRRRRIRRTAQTLVLLAGVVGVGVMAGQSGMGPLSFLQDDDEVQSVAAAGEETAPTTEPVPADGSTTSTVLELERRSFEVGDCVLWDQSVHRVPSTRQVEVVDCARPHLMEVTGKVELERGPYPSEATWDAMFDTGACAELGAAYLGGTLDPRGHYVPRGIIPQEEGWRYGDREVWCGLGRFPMEEDRLHSGTDEPFEGAVDRSGQHRIYPVGSCLGPDGEGLTFGTVSCDGPHVVEISGHVDLSGRIETLPTSEQYSRLVGDACERAGKVFAGANFRDPVQAGWMHIEQGSWDAGRRTVECTVAEYRNQDSLTITRRLGAPPA